MSLLCISCSKVGTMNMFLRIFVSAMLAALLADARICKTPKSELGGARPCTKYVEGTTSSASEEECGNERYCCIWKGECWMEIQDTKIPESIDTGEGELQKIYHSIKSKISQTGDSSRRFLSLGSACPVQKVFPQTCSVTPSTAFVLDPPMDIPYCFRIPCDSTNPKVEQDIAACASRPGCYFDKELFEMRRLMGGQIMPGAPVCHLAIRNSVFQREANAYMRKFNTPWTPYFTHCLLDTYKDEIKKQPEGCTMINVLEYFGVKAKLAGWKTITTGGCILIGGCWRDGYGCFYPVNLNTVSVKSRQMKSLQNSRILPYGRPLCQHFDNSGPKEALKSIHDCLRSGCTLDDRMNEAYFKYMYQIGSKLNNTEHWMFWLQVQEGIIRADNIDDIEIIGLGKGLPMEYALLSSMWQTGSSNTMVNPFDASGLMGLAGSGMFPINTQMPTPNLSGISGLLFGNQQRFCGPEFMMLGGRPCEPLAPSVPNPTFCPYKKYMLGGIPWLKPLKGSVDGCCDINFCYISKTEISNMHSGASYYYTPWSFWSECSESCGLGVRTRERSCVGERKPTTCTDPVKETSSCTTTQCSGSTGWSPWSECSATCNKGVRKSTRTCEPGDTGCDRQKEKTEYCNDVPCIVKYSPWEPWARSCDPCGTSRQRSRRCQQNPCNANDLVEVEICSDRCGTWTAWGSWSTCSFSFSTFRNTKKRTRECTLYGKPGAKCSSGESSELTNCQSAFG